MAYNFNLPFESTRNVGCAEIKRFFKGAQCPLKHGNYVAMVKREILPWSDVPLFMTSVSIATKTFLCQLFKIFVNNSLPTYKNNENQCRLANVGTK